MGTRLRWLAAAAALVLVAVLGLVLALVPGGGSSPRGRASGAPPPSGVAAEAPCGPFAGSTDTAADGTALVCWYDPDGQLRWRRR